MRLWSLHPKYLDRQGLLAVWREGLLAQSVLLKGEYGKCLKNYGEHDFCVHNSTTKKIHCINCGKPKVKTPYWNHPQLNRFKTQKEPIEYIGTYLNAVYLEASERGYHFDWDKINYQSYRWKRMEVTSGQLEYEFERLQKKLISRDMEQRMRNIQSLKNWKGDYVGILPHPLFTIIEGDIESWEKIK